MVEQVERAELNQVFLRAHERAVVCQPLAEGSARDDEILRLLRQRQAAPQPVRGARHRFDACPRPD